jgi:leader peptidase (prepilin peptidase)/N-methyltransferase
MPFLLEILPLDLEGAARWFFVGAAACFGAAVGSFLNVCVWRMPREGLGVSKPARSFCPLCGAAIAWFDNLPVLSWLALGGRCRSCRAPIAARYPLVEALTGVLFAVVTDRFLFETGGTLWGLGVLLVLMSALVVAVFIDIDLRILPDEVTVGGMHFLPIAMVLLPELRIGSGQGSVCRLLVWISEAGAPLRGSGSGELLGTGTVVGVLVVVALVLFVVGAAVYRAYRRWRLPEEPRRFRDVSLAGLLTAASGCLVLAIQLRPEWALSPSAYSLGACLLGMLAGSSMVWIIGVVATKIFRKPAMGFGDVKLMGLLGGMTGWSGALIGFLGACVLGSVWGIGRLIVSRDRYLPFGPFLTIACVALYLWPGFFPVVLEWYLGLFALAR